jgi:RNA polymerase sigma-70 factor (ECF subfamily)
MSRPTHGASLRARIADDASPQEPGAAAERDVSWLAHIGWLRAALRRRFGAEFADDIAHETYLRVADRMASDDIQNVRGLLYSVATNLARDVFRRDRVRMEHAARALEAPLAAPGRTAEDDLEIKQAILSLPPKLGEVLLLSKIGGLTNREIAQRYGLSVRAIDKRLQKAITLFVAKLRD